MVSRYLIFSVGWAGGICISLASVQAATTTTTFSVTATVQATCLVSANNLAFGVYTGAQADVTTTVSVSCTTTTPYNVGLNIGTGTGATMASRKMTGPSSALLNYSLYRNSNRTQVWGDTVNTDTVAGTGDGTAQVLTVYGSIPASQLVPMGSYSDTIVVTVTY